MTTTRSRSATPTSSSRPTSVAGRRPRSNGRSSGSRVSSSSRPSTTWSKCCRSPSSRSACPRSPAASSPRCTGPRTSPSTSAVTGTTRSRWTVARSSSSSVTSPATASRPRASWAGFATACAPTPSTTPIRRNLLRRAHEMLRRLDPDSMVTAVVACYQPDTGVLTWSRAGHPPPLLCEADGTTRFLEDVNATPLGTFGKNFATAQVTLTDGALLVLYTDGLIERRERLIDEGLDWLAAAHAHVAQRTARRPLREPGRPVVRVQPVAQTTSACWPCASPQPSSRRVDPRHRHRWDQARGRPRDRAGRAARAP